MIFSRSHHGLGARSGFQLRAVLGLLCAALLLSGCGRSDTQSNERPKVLRLAFTTQSEEELERRQQAYNDLGAYLSERLGIKVEVVKGAAYSAAIEAMRAGKIDVINASPMPYLVARAKCGAVPLVTPTNPDGTPSDYYSLFIVRPDSGLRSLEDLKARSKQLVLAFADPVSTSGHLIPRGALENVSINPERDLKQVIFSGSHTASVMSVKSGKVDVATVTKTTLDRMLTDGRVKAGEVVSIWQSEPLLQSVMFTRAGLPEDFRKELQAAYCDVHRARPDIWAGLRILSVGQATHFAPVEDSAFEPIRKIVRQIEHMKLLD